MNKELADKIIAFVEDSEGRPRLDNLAREVRYQLAKGYLLGTRDPEVLKRIEGLQTVNRHHSEDLQATRELYGIAQERIGGLEAQNKVYREALEKIVDENTNQSEHYFIAKEALEGDHYG